MSRFNVKVKPTVTTNLAGGEAYSQSPKLEFVSILLTSFVQDQYYRSANDTTARVVTLLPLVGSAFAAKAALYARNVFGMRSVSHIVGAEIAHHSVKTDLRFSKVKFLERLFRRPDDMLEVMAYYQAKFGAKPIPNCLKRAIRNRLATLDDYTLAKYRGEGKDLNMIDLVRLTHPKYTTSIEKLVKGELKSTDTWETKMTQAGQVAATQEEKEELKTNAWRELLEERKLGYLALLRNCRNIFQQAPDYTALLCAQLSNSEAIKKSLVFPFQIDTAINECLKAGAPRNLIGVLCNALEMSVQNVPVFEGKTLVAVDISSSMRSAKMGKSERCVSDIASLFAATLYKASDADLMLFEGVAVYANAVPYDTTYSIAQTIKRLSTGGSTNFKSIFYTANKKYDRIIILSDMQGWVGHHSPAGELALYKKKYACSPHVYSFDLAGYGSMQFPDHQTYCMAGFSDKTFDVMKLLEQDKNALVNTIEAVELC